MGHERMSIEIPIELSKFQRRHQHLKGRRRRRIAEVGRKFATSKQAGQSVASTICFSKANAVGSWHFG